MEKGEYILIDIDDRVFDIRTNTLSKRNIIYISLKAVLTNTIKNLIEILVAFILIKLFNIHI